MCVHMNKEAAKKIIVLFLFDTARTGNGDIMPSFIYTSQWRIIIVNFGHLNPPPPRFNFFHFHAVFRTIWPNNILVPT